MLLAINAGYYNTKVCVGNQLHVIASRVQVNPDAEESILHEGVLYEVGAGHRSLDDKTESLCHKLMTEYALLKYAKGSHVKLLVVLPLLMYLNKAYREAYKESLLGEHVGVVCGRNVRVTVEECVVFAEGAAAYIHHKELLEGEVVGLLDFGGNTINCMIYNRGDLIRDTVSQLDLGIIKLERQLIDAINLAKLWNVQEYELADIIEKRVCEDIVVTVVNSFVQEIKQRLIEKKWNIDRLLLFITGGGTVMLGRYLESAFANVIISETPLYDNVLGLMKVGELLYDEE